MICSAECRFLAMISCLPNVSILRDYSHKEWTGYWGAGHEDLHRTDREQNPDRYESDEDFNDNVFCISPIEIGALSNTNIPVAGEDCVADLNSDGVLNYFDIVRYIELFSALDPEADLNGDGDINFFDLLVLIDAFETGC